MSSEDLPVCCSVFLLVGLMCSSLIICSIVVADYTEINNNNIDATCILTGSLDLTPLLGGAKGKISVNYTVDNATYSGFVFYPPTHFPHLVLRSDSDVRVWFTELNGAAFDCMMNMEQHEGVSDVISNIYVYIICLVITVLVWLLVVGGICYIFDAASYFSWKIDDLREKCGW